MKFSTQSLRVAVLLTLLLLALVSGIYFDRASQAQSGDQFELKAELELKRAYQAFRTRSGFQTSAVVERERNAIKSRVAVTETNGRAQVGVILRLREGSADQRSQEEKFAAAETELRNSGFRVASRLGNIVTIESAIDDLPRLAEFSSIENLYASTFQFTEAEEIREIKVRSKAELQRVRRRMNDLSNQAIKAPEARTNYNVTGKGVIVGIIDSGIDVKHGDFRNANGTTRIKYFWDLSSNEGTGPNNLGKVFTEADLNQLLQANGAVPIDTDGHGSHVAGTAAGNGLGAGNGGTADMYRGIAPEADLIVVKATRAGSNSFRTDDTINAIAWIRDRAAELNNSYVVINYSIGGQRGNRDGTDPVEVAIDNFVSSGSNRQFCTSAGNTGSRRNHTGGVIAQGTEVTLPFNMNSSSSGIQLIYNGSDTLNARVIKPDGTIIGPIGFNQVVDSNASFTLTQSASLTSNGARHIFVECKSVGCESGQWRLVLSGESVKNGRYDAWALDQTSTTFDITVASNANETGHPKGVKRGLVVANYVTRSEWIDVNGTTQTRTTQGPVGRFANSSSGGPSRDARLKPNLAAPGTYILSTYSADRPFPGNTEIGRGGKHRLTFGTSMASPAVVGTIALMLQAAKDRGRNLSPDTIARLLHRTVINDSNTGDSISYKYGYGKVNALEAVKAVVDNLYAAEFVSINAAGYMPDTVATTNSIMAGFGANLAASVLGATSLPLPTSLGGVQVRLTDKNAQQQLAPLFFVSPGQINYLLPGNLPAGVVFTEVIRDGTVIARGAVSVTTAWPAFFTANSSGGGLGAANVLRVRNSQLIYESPTVPIDLGIQGDVVYLVLYGTGLRNVDKSKVKIFLGGTPLIVEFVGAAPGFEGLDQINVIVPNSLAGRGLADLLTYADGWAGNTIQFTIK